MSYKKKYKAVIFDMDGTIINNMMAHHYAWQEKLKRLGLSLSIEEVQEKIHGTNEEIIDRLFQDRFTAEEITMISKEKEQHYRNTYKDQLTLIKGLSSFFDVLKAYRIPMGIGTAAPEENVAFVLDNLQIRDIFDTVVHSGMVNHGKPHPEVFINVAERLNVPVEECLIFEDSPTGARTADNAGADAIIVTTTHQPEEFRAIKNVRAFISDYTPIEITPHHQSSFSLHIFL